ncbi:MAG: GntR family transcriptional regulator [Bacillota bacterium]|jgi:GntR family transcriptional regulator of arabinose operon|nr:GntR family transcriptional regulator [Bacillota bacterium]HHT90977.1 substrate-binding domain-containing protein [Bacillota bacterium]
MRGKEEPGRDSVPLHQEIENELAERIRSGELVAGRKLPPELKLADEFQVSRTTIRHALISLESKGLVERIHGRGTFVADKTGKKRERSGEERSIYAIVPHLTSSFTGTIIMGAQEELYAKGYHLSVLPTNDDPQKEMDYLRIILESRAGGVLLQPTKSEYYNPVVTELIQQGIPLVMMGRYYRFVNCSYVDGHNYQGAYDAIAYLVGLGHEKIGLVTKKPLIHTSLEDRIQGYRDAMADHGLAILPQTLLMDLADSRNVYWDSASATYEQEIVNRLVDYLEAAPEMTAVFALNDRIAGDLIKAAKHCGRVVGRDLSIVGFDNVSLSESLDPPLTTIDAPTFAVGKRAAEILLDHMANEQSEPTKEHLPMHLVIRDSCGPNPRE